jgi:hypothetical protein
MKRRKKPAGECTIPPPIDVSALPDLVFGQPEHEERRVRAYMADQACDETVIHLEKVGTESLMGRKMGFWDVRTDKGKWWVITNPTNLYSQALFPSLDYTVSFHVGVTTRMLAREHNYEGSTRVRRILPTLKRLESAGNALDSADEVEDFQAVGMKLRECLLTLIHTLAKPEHVPTGEDIPNRSDFIRWSELIAEAVAAGSRAQRIRGYLKAVAKAAWQVVNWLTHASNALLHDARVARLATENVVAAFLTAVERHESAAPDRCPACGSYRVQTDYRPDLGIDPPYILLCERCDWVAPKEAAGANGPTTTVGRKASGSRRKKSRTQ